MRKSISVSHRPVPKSIMCVLSEFRPRRVGRISSRDADLAIQNVVCVVTSVLHTSFRSGEVYAALSMHRRADFDELYPIIALVNALVTAHSLCRSDRLFSF